MYNKYIPTFEQFSRTNVTFDEKFDEIISRLDDMFDIQDAEEFLDRFTSETYELIGRRFASRMSTKQALLYFETVSKLFKKFNRSIEEVHRRLGGRGLSAEDRENIQKYNRGKGSFNYEVQKMLSDLDAMSNLSTKEEFLDAMATLIFKMKMVGGEVMLRNMGVENYKQMSRKMSDLFKKFDLDYDVLKKRMGMRNKPVGDRNIGW